MVRAKSGNSNHAIVPLHLHCQCLNKDFVHNPIGNDANRYHLHHFSLYDNRALHEVIDNFSRIIQSGKPADHPKAEFVGGSNGYHTVYQAI